MSARKSSGLAHNPLLSRTEADAVDEQVPAAKVPVRTRGQREAAPDERVDTSTSEQVDTSTRTRVSDGSLKFTFYFTEEQLDRLDQVWETLRRVRRRPKRRVSKSQFVRVALDRLLDEFEKNPDQVTRALLAHADAPKRSVTRDGEPS